MINLNDYGVHELSQAEKVETNGGAKFRLTKWWHYAVAAVVVLAFVL